jgi:putative ABC transport system permease protein
MNLRQAFKMAYKSIFAKKGRSVLTMLGIIIGVASVMTLVSFVNGSNQKMMEYYESMGTNKISVSAYKWNGADISSALYDYCLGLHDLVVGVTPDLYSWGTGKYGTKNSQSMEYPPEIRLGSDQYSACNNFNIALGRDLSYLDIQDYSQVCVLGWRAKENFFNYADPVGETISINGIPVKVIGVYKEKDPDNLWSLDNIIVLPYTMNRDLNHTTRMEQFVVKARDSQSTSEAVTRISGFLAGVMGQQDGYYSVVSQNEWMESSNEYNRMLSLVLGGIAGISLLVGGIGIMNIMLVTVTERTREIGIRKAIGAERRSIVVQFLIEASMICGIGGIVGILLGILGTLIAGKLILDMIIMPSSTITAGAFLFSVALGIIFGLYPAVKASGLQPVVALRTE